MNNRHKQIHLKRASKTKVVTLNNDWLNEYLAASADDDIYAFPVPETEAVVLLKLDPFNPIPSKIANLLFGNEDFDDNSENTFDNSVDPYA